MSSPLEIYVSASISNAHDNAFIASVFPASDFYVHLPQKIVPDQLSHVEYPLHVYQQCIEMMTASHMGLVLFDAFGRDCAWECGWYAAQPHKKLVGFVQSGSVFLRDWMVKGGLDALITTNPRLFEVCQNNPLLSQKPLVYIESLSDLPEKMRQYWFDGHF